MIHTFSNYDYLVIGSIGFHQVGDIYETSKRLVENAVIKKLVTTKRFKVPTFLSGIAWLQIKTFHHDAGSYDELCVIYDYVKINDWERASEEEVQELFHEFWNWVNHLEEFNWESEELLQRCEKMYSSHNANLLNAAS